MSMHLERPMLNTLNTKKRRKNKSNKQKRADDQHLAFLETYGVSPQQLRDKRKKSKKPSTQSAFNADTARAIQQSNADISSVAGVAAKRDARVYSGERKLLGIAAMHKSNLVPVFDAKDAEDYAKMRRG